MKMKPVTRRAVDSIRACGRLNLIQALSATLAGRPSLALYHRKVSALCRHDARQLALTGSAGRKISYRRQPLDAIACKDG